MDEIVLRCHWNAQIVCKNEYLCAGCEHQPANEDKPNGKADPISIRWKEGYGGIEPQCPSCGEMPYNLDRCVFCGQHFLPDKIVEEWKKPPEEARMDCFFCGGKGTLVWTRSRYNNHFHGECEKCGARVIE